MADDIEVQSHLPGERAMTTGQLRFAGRLFVYHEGNLPEELLDRVAAGAAEADIAIQFRGPTFAAERTALERPLAFISHDSRDKDVIARPLAFELVKIGCPVWFDEFSLNVGDRLRESIERGLTEARKCVLVITPNFLANPGWTRVEFNGIFTRELVERRDVVLPVWHNVTQG
jgi:hypothetical protein